MWHFSARCECWLALLCQTGPTPCPPRSCLPTQMGLYHTHQTCRRSVCQVASRETSLGRAPHAAFSLSPRGGEFSHHQRKLTDPRRLPFIANVVWFLADADASPPVRLCAVLIPLVGDAMCMARRSGMLNFQYKHRLAPHTPFARAPESQQSSALSVVCCPFLPFATPCSPTRKQHGELDRPGTVPGTGTPLRALLPLASSSWSNPLLCYPHPSWRAPWHRRFCVFFALGGQERSEARSFWRAEPCWHACHMHAARGHGHM
jgi:hypothetical protein